MLYSYNLLQNYIKQKLPSASQMNEMFNRCLGDSSFSKVKNDFVFDIELSTNRVGVLAGHKNLACEICAMFNFSLKENKVFKLKKVNSPILMNVKNEAKKSCECYFGIVLKDIKIKDSPEFIKDALQNCGMRSINNIVDITNYVMLELGQPMHAFDYDKIIGNKIIVRYAKPNEEITVLTGDKYKLNENILVIANSEKPMAIAGIKGGVDAEINKNTKMIVLESANFKNTDIYKTSKSLNLITDASIRFSHTISPNVTREALKRAVELLEKYADAKIASNELISNEISDKMMTLPLNLSKASKLVGQAIPEKDIERILSKLNYKIKKISKELWNISIPWYRTNIFVFEDIVDDLVRIYGLDNLKAIPPKVELSSIKSNQFYQFKENIKDYAITVGLNEVYNYNFINDGDLRTLPKKLQIKVFGPKNFMSLNFKYMNPAAFVSLIKNVASNLSYFDKAGMFQISSNYLNNGNAILEKTYFSFGIYDSDKKRKEIDMLLEAKGIIETIFEKLSINKSQYYFSDKKIGDNFWEDEVFKTLIYIYNGKDEYIGYLGLVPDKLKIEYKIKNDQKNPLALVSEIDLTKIYQMTNNALDFKPIPKYPSSIKDISIAVDRLILVQDVILTILQLKIEDLKDVDLFDIYDMDDKKSLSFHLIFRNDNKTLELEEVDKYMEMIKQHLIKQGYSIR
jgi:phenylalanyl-tRNA synthetase beta chain